MWKSKKPIEWAVKNSLDCIRDIKNSIGELYGDSYLPKNGNVLLSNALNNIDNYLELFEDVDKELEDTVIIENISLKEENAQYRVQIRELKRQLENKNKQLEAMKEHNDKFLKALADAYQKDAKTIESAINIALDNNNKVMNDLIKSNKDFIKSNKDFLGLIENKVNVIATSEYMKIKDKSPKVKERAPRYNRNINNEKIKELYEKDKKSISEIAETLGVSYVTVQKRLKDMKVELRDERLKDIKEVLKEERSKDNEEN